MNTFVGDIIEIALETFINLTGLTLQIKYRKPDGTPGFWPAAIDPTDNSIMIYETTEFDLDVFGTWRLQAFATYNNIVRLHGTYCELHVFEPIPDALATTLAPTTV